MKRLTLALAGLLLAACAQPTYTDLVDAALAPVVEEAPNEISQYLMPGAIPDHLPISVPPETEVIGTTDGLHPETRVYMRTALEREEVIAYYREAYAEDPFVLRTDHIITFCIGADELTVRAERGNRVEARYQPSSGLCGPQQNSPTPAFVPGSATIYDFLPDVGLPPLSRATAQATSTGIIAAEGRTVEEMVAEYRAQFEAEGWQYTAATLSERTAWVVWGQTDEEAGPLRLEMTLNLQSAEAALLTLRVAMVLP